MSERRLAEIREALDLSQEKMAKLLGVSFASINRWENGHSSPAGTTYQVYRALDVAIKKKKSRDEIVKALSGDPGQALLVIFEAAYGGR